MKKISMQTASGRGKLREMNEKKRFVAMEGAVLVHFDGNNLARLLCN